MFDFINYSTIITFVLAIIWLLYYLEVRKRSALEDELDRALALIDRLNNPNDLNEDEDDYTCPECGGVRIWLLDAPSEDYSGTWHCLHCRGEDQYVKEHMKGLDDLGDALDAIKEAKGFPAYYEDTSVKPCSVCGEEMTRGDEECSGFCSKCYWEAVEDKCEVCGGPAGDHAESCVNCVRF